MSTSTGFDPYYRWLGIRDAGQPPNHYRLLGLNMFEDDPEVITGAAMRQIRHVRTYQLGEHGDLCHKILNELALAKSTLLNPQERLQYDRQIRLAAQATETRRSVPSGNWSPRPYVPDVRGDDGASSIERLPRLVNADASSYGTAVSNGRQILKELSLSRRTTWTAGVAVAVSAILLFGVLILVRTPEGTVQIELSDPTAAVQVSVDGNSIELSGLDRPLRLTPKEHQLVVTGDGFETVSNSFTVRRGTNTLVHVTLIPDSQSVEQNSINSTGDEPREPETSQSSALRDKRIREAGRAAEASHTEAADTAPDSGISSAKKVPAGVAPSQLQSADESGPDLIVSALVAEVVAPGRVSYAYTIKNVGTNPANLDGPTNGNADNVSVQAFVSRDEVFHNDDDQPAGGTILGRSPLGLLQPGETRSGQFSASLKGEVNELPYLVLMVDWGKSINETNETNNYAAAKLKLATSLDSGGDEILPKQGELVEFTEGTRVVRDYGTVNAGRIVSTPESAILRLEYGEDRGSTGSPHSGYLFDTKRIQVGLDAVLVFRHRGHGVSDLRLNLRLSNQNLSWFLTVPDGDEWREVRLPLGEKFTAPVDECQTQSLHVTTFAGQPNDGVGTTEYLEIDGFRLEKLRDQRTQDGVEITNRIDKSTSDQAFLDKFVRVADVMTDRSKYRVGERITIKYSIVNTSGEDLFVPENRQYSRSTRLLGSVQKWIELVDAPGRASTGERKWPDGGSIFPYAERVLGGKTRIDQEHLIRRRLEPGRYRYVVEWKSNNGEQLNVESAEFEVVAH